MLSKQKTSFERYAVPFVDLFEHVNPNLLTCIGSIPSLLFFVCILMHWYILALIVFLGNIFDLVDGMVARKFGKVTKFGGFLDSTLDRVSDFLIISAFAFGGIAQWEIVAPLLLFSFLTSYVRSRGELASESSVSFAVGIIERPERLLIIFFGLIGYVVFSDPLLFHLNILEWVLLILTLLSLTTVCQRIGYAYKKLSR